MTLRPISFPAFSGDDSSLFEDLAKHHANVPDLEFLEPDVTITPRMFGINTTTSASSTAAPPLICSTNGPCTQQDSTQVLPQTQEIPDLSQLHSQISLLAPVPWGRLWCVKSDQRHDLFKNNVILGRSPNADVRLTSIECSKEHCRLYRLVADEHDANAETLCMIQDNSTNGTYVNRQRLKRGVETVLKDGDEVEIKIGHRFIFCSVNEETLGAPDALLSSDPEAHELLSRYHFDVTLGRGTYAIVRRVWDLKQKSLYACKIVDKRRAGIRATDNNLLPLNDHSEIRILLDLDHPNIVRIHEVAQSTRYLYLFLELVRGGELFEYLASKGAVSEKECQFCMFQLFKAIKYLHDRDITHRDIKPENVLLSSKTSFSRLLLTDFGLAKAVGGITSMRTLCGTLNYLAPEVLQMNQGRPGYTKAVDCWSMGVMLYFLLSGSLPFDHAEDFELKLMIQNAPIRFRDPHNLGIWERVSSDCKDIIIKLLNRNPSKRLTVNQALEHPWIAKDVESLERMYAQVIPQSQLNRGEATPCKPRNLFNGISGATTPQVSSASSGDNAALRMDLHYEEE